MSGRTVHQTIRVRGSQDYGQQAVVISDTQEETTAHLDSKEIVQDTDTEEAIIVSSDCEEVTQDAESEHEGILISDSEEQADSGQEFTLASVDTQEVVCPHLAMRAR